MRDAVAQRRNGPVVAAAVELWAAVGLVGHPRGALERRPLVPIADVEEVEHAAHEILPAVAVERRRVAAPECVEPLGGLRWQVQVHRRRYGREEERLGGRVVVYEHLRVPAQDAVHHRPHFRLALGQEVAVHVEAEVVVASRDAPGLAPLEARRLVGAHRHRVVPRGKAFVPVGVGRRVEHQHDILEDVERGGLVGGEHLVGDLHRRLEARRLVAVHCVLEEHDRGVLGGDLRRPRRSGLAGVGELGDVGADLIEPGEVRGIGDDQRADRPVLERLTPALHAYAPGRAAHQRVEIVLQYGVHRLLLARRVPGDRLGARYRRAIGAARVEVELLCAGGRREEDTEQERGKQTTYHDALRGEGARKCRARCGRPGAGGALGVALLSRCCQKHLDAIHRPLYRGRVS